MLSAKYGLLETTEIGLGTAIRCDPSPREDFWTSVLEYVGAEAVPYLSVELINFLGRGHGNRTYGIWWVVKCAFVFYL
jgi:hypothetical protein